MGLPKPRLFQRQKKDTPNPKHGEGADPRVGEAMAKIQDLQQTIAYMNGKHLLEIRDINSNAQLELQRHQDQLASTKQLLDDRSKELAIAQQFLTTADSLAEADVIRMVKGINEEILQTAALLGETGNLSDTPRLQPEAGFEETLASRTDLPTIHKIPARVSPDPRSFVGATNCCPSLLGKLLRTHRVRMAPRQRQRRRIQGGIPKCAANK
jgi:hypothetical protein